MIGDIAYNYGYNEFLAERLFQLFNVNEVNLHRFRLRKPQVTKGAPF